MSQDLLASWPKAGLWADHAKNKMLETLDACFWYLLIYIYRIRHRRPECIKVTISKSLLFLTLRVRIGKREASKDQCIQNYTQAEDVGLLSIIEGIPVILAVVYLWRHIESFSSSIDADRSRIAVLVNGKSRSKTKIG